MPNMSREEFFSNPSAKPATSPRSKMRWETSREKRRKKKPGRPAQWKFHPTEGAWHSLFLQKCRETGYVHTTGPWAGKPNLYRLACETGLSRQSLHKLSQNNRPIGMELLGKLCDAFHCQPNDFLKRVTRDLAVTSSQNLPLMNEDDLPGDEYVHPSQL